MIYANENDLTAAQWLQHLPLPIDHVDARSIVDVVKRDLEGYTQCHFFAGIGGWPLALEMAGWPESLPVWTGSCPCQPFSSAGKRQGTADARHLWPEFRRLIDECRPSTIFGEQVASKAGRAWLASVRADLEILGYAVGAADLCAAGVGAPHARQRLFWVAYSEHYGFNVSTLRGCVESGEKQGGLQQHKGRYTDNDWGEVLYYVCRDGKARPCKPEVGMLANGLPGEVAQLRGLGNAIVPQVAAAFIESFMEVVGCRD